MTGSSPSRRVSVSVPTRASPSSCRSVTAMPATAVTARTAHSSEWMSSMTSADAGTFTCSTAPSGRTTVRSATVGSVAASQTGSPNGTVRSMTRPGAYTALIAVGGSGTKPGERSATVGDRERACRRCR